MPQDLTALKAELQWSLENCDGPRTEATLLWAIELVENLQREQQEVAV